MTTGTCWRTPFTVAFKKVEEKSPVRWISFGRVAIWVTPERDSRPERLSVNCHLLSASGRLIGTGPPNVTVTLSFRETGLGCDCPFSENGAALSAELVAVTETL